MFYISKEDNIGSSVKDFTKAFLDEVEKALIEDNYQPCAEKESHIKIELHAIGIKEGGAGLKIQILTLGGKLSDTNTQKITVYAKKISEADKIEEQARIKKAELTIKLIADGIIV